MELWHGLGKTPAEGVSKCSIPHPLALGFEVSADIKVCPELCWSCRDLIEELQDNSNLLLSFPPLVFAKPGVRCLGRYPRKTKCWDQMS